MAITGGAMIRPFGNGNYVHNIRNVTVEPIDDNNGVHSAPIAGCVIDGLTVVGGGDGVDGYALLVGRQGSTAHEGLYSNIVLNPYDGNGLVLDDAMDCVFSNILINRIDTHGILLEDTNLDAGSNDNVFNGIRMDHAGRVNPGDSIRITDGNRNVFDAIHITSPNHRTAVDFSGGVGNVLGTHYIETGQTDHYLETVLYDNDFGPIIGQPWNMSGVIVTKTGALRLPMLFDADILEVETSLNTAPTGSSVIADVHLNGTTIFPTQADRPTIATSGFGDKAEPTTPVLALADDYITVDVDQKDSNDVASDLLVVVRMRRR